MKRQFIHSMKGGATKTKNYTKRTIFLMGTIFLLVFFSFLPTVSGYGTSFATAVIKTTGGYQETMAGSHNDSYYKVDCPSGLTLAVSIFMRSPVDLDLYLYDPSLNQVAYSLSSSISDSVEYPCPSSGYYYIRIHRYLGSGPATFIMSISLTLRIPNSDVLLMIFGLLGLLGVIICLIYILISQKESCPPPANEENYNSNEFLVNYLQL